MAKGWKKESSKQSQLLSQILNAGSLGDENLRDLGFNPLTDLDSLTAIIYQINIKI